MSDDVRTPDNCSFRRNVRTGDTGEEANCDLLHQITDVDDTALTTICRAACDACCDSFVPTIRDLNPIIASLLFSISEQICDAGGTDGCTAQRASELNQWAEKSLPAVAPDEDDGVDASRQRPIDFSDVSVDQISQLLPPPPSRAGEKVRDWAVGVTTSPRRMPTLQQTVTSIRHAGWDTPVLFVDGDVNLSSDHQSSTTRLEISRRDTPIGAFPNYVLSLWELYMRNPMADAYLMIQDDALLLGTPAMREYLEQILWPVEGPCIASLYCSTQYTQANAGWHRFQENWVWGAVAFVFSREAVKTFLTSPCLMEHRELPDDQGLSKIDVLIGHFACAMQIPIFYPSPSLVQHIGTISTIWETARAVHTRRADQFVGDLLTR
ncbi:MAG: hypothetical protein HKN47_19400 [Pirellulaceae bacterium]|nr:hypothetical protein [Pirellulaceae bacterium]